MSDIEKELVAAMVVIDNILAKGFCISVNDGEDWVVSRSKDRDAIQQSLQSADTDQIRIRDADGNIRGWVLFVWGNSPDEVVADYLDTPLVRELVDGATP